MKYSTQLPVSSIGQRQLVESAVPYLRIGAQAEQRVMRSWRRCFEQHSLDPAQPRTPAIVDSAELSRRRAALGATYAIVRAAMLRLSAAFDRTLCAIFTDAEGVILHYMALPAFAQQARGLRVGAIWSESEQGTNGMGTCLVDREPVVIEQSHHFLAQNKGLTCFAMPVFHPRGELLGALDISCHNLPPHAPMLALLDLAILDIENRLLQQSAHEGIVSFSPNRFHIGTALEGSVSIDAQGRVTGANRAALRLLGVCAQQQVFGKPLQELFGSDVDKAVSSRDPAVFRCRPPYEGGAGHEHYYLRVQFSAVTPGCAAREEIRPVRAAVAAAERGVLLEALQRWDWNVSQAARALGIGRKTLYRKLGKHRIRPDLC